MAYLPYSYDPWVVACSLLIASFASYVALDLARRVRGSDDSLAMSWWIGGSVAMGSGVWSTHFVGMLAFELPIELGYGGLMTAVSWAAAVASSAIALFVASRDTMHRRHLAIGALTMGLGISSMHYLGMAALDMAPGIVWAPWAVAASVAIAVGASAIALQFFSSLRRANAERGLSLQAPAAGVMGVAICGMHYTGMSAAAFPADSVCLGIGGLSGHSLGVLVVVAVVTLLTFTLFTSHFDANIQARTSGLNEKLRNANEQLRQRAQHDPLTGLPNRLLFERKLAQAIQRIELAKAEGRETGKIVVMFVDLDGFKPVNDTLGHAVGDLVLQEVAMRLRSSVRAGDTVARIGGDEFVMLMECETTVADPVVAARRIVESVGASITNGSRAIQISCSVGIASYPEHGPKERLIAHADAAMYEAKRNGGSSWAHFNKHMQDAAPEMLGLQNDLRLAIARSQLELYYQPKVDARTGETHGVEALLRWMHPLHGMVSPTIFIPLAERFGLIGKLGNWVIDEACRQIEVWAGQGMRMTVAINLSVHQLREQDLADRIEQAMRRHRIDSDQLLCEITESVAMGDVDATQDAFERLARIGVLLSIDDFGTGYSSLSYLRRLPARQLKIDRMFVSDLETSGDARAIVSAVVHLAHDLGLGVVAEGVETEGQRDVLIALDCDELQGYFFARPMPANNVVGWLAARTLAADEQKSWAALKANALALETLQEEEEMEEENDVGAPSSLH
ncbi:MAG: EAL domain-containing protein [Burkholderiaceae bacterium]